jgi:predicted dinucleotide-binding enzyme
MSKGRHVIFLGVQDLNIFKGQDLLKNPHTFAMPVQEAVAAAECKLPATPAPAAINVAKSLGDTNGKIIIDAMNIILKKEPAGFNNMVNPMYGDTALDLFVAGDSAKGKEAAKQLAKVAGFVNCYDIGRNDKFELMEQFAWFWINLAMFQGQGREIGIKLLKR